MENKDKAFKIGAMVVAFALILRLFAAGIGGPGPAPLLPFLVFLQTGRIVRYPQSIPVESVPPASAPTVPTDPPIVLPVFSAGEADNLDMLYGCNYRPDLEKLLQMPLSWDLTGEEPTVLIVHTHATEAYTQVPGWEYKESSDYHTQNIERNMVAIGDALAQHLQELGISVLHDRSYHDEPAYNGSYSSSRNAIKRYLEQYPSIQMVLDLHRDAAASSADKQLNTTATVDGEASTQIMLVLGTDTTGPHPHWQDNLALGLKLAAILERNDPGICRPLHLRKERFNMDLTTGSLLVEMGGAGDTQQEALVAAWALARAVAELAHGTG